MDSASAQPGDLLLSAPPTHSVGGMEDLYRVAEAQPCGLSPASFADCLTALGARLNFGLPPGTAADEAQCIAFYRGLKLGEFALAQACALGLEPAWERFVATYRTPMLQAAISISGSATLGHDLADSLYAELYGLRASAGERRSPLASYSGRGSLLGWLRSTLAQRHVDRHRRTHRETPLDKLDTPAPVQQPASLPAHLQPLTAALGKTLRALPAEDRYMLSAYFLDRQTLLQLARLLKVHEATISRRLKRLTEDLRKHLLVNLQAGGLSRRAAEETLGTDPRDIEINLRALLQTSQLPPFLNTAGDTAVDTAGSAGAGKAGSI